MTEADGKKIDFRSAQQAENSVADLLISSCPRKLTVPETFEHPKGFTLYKIAIDFVFADALESVPISFYCWRRFSDLHYLHENLSLAHEQLHLRGNFPDFPKPQLFGRHEEFVVKNRQLKAEAYLSHAVNDPVLKRNVLLHKLFEGAKLTAADQALAGNRSNESPCLSPTLLWTSQEYSNEDDHTEMAEPSSTTSPPRIVEPDAADAADRLSSLRTELDRLSFSKQSSEDGGISTPERHLEVDDVLSTDELRYFDPFAVQNPQDNPGNSAATNSWLLASLNQLKSDESSSARTNSSNLTLPMNRDRANSDLQLRNDFDFFGSNEFTNFSVFDPSNSSARPDVHDSLTANFDSTEGNSSNSPPNDDRSRIARFFPKVQSTKIFLSPTKNSDLNLKPVKSEGNFANLINRESLDSSRSASGSPKSQALEFLQKSFSPRKKKFDEKNSNFGEKFGEKEKFGDKDDYLCQAAQFISSAQRSEAEGHYDLAFSCYKAGVNLLLRGVQDEQDVGRRNAVRTKTAKYLMRAERIFSAYLL